MNLNIFFCMFFISCELTSSTKNNLIINFEKLKQDSLKIILKNKYIDDNILGVTDEFQSEFLFSFGNNYIKKTKIIEDWHWKHNLVYVIPENLSEIEFERKNEFWFVNTNNINLDKYINFEVDFRKNIEPINSFSQEYMKYYYPNKSIYDKKINLREEKINKYFTKKIKYLNTIFNNKNDSLYINNWAQIIKFQKLEALTFLPNFNNWDKNYLNTLINLKYEYNNDNFLSSLPCYRRGLLNLAALLNYLDYGNNFNNLTNEISIAKNFSGKNYDFLIMNLLINTKENQNNIYYSKIDFNNLLNKFLLTCKSQDYKKYIEKMLVLDGNVNSNWEILNLSGKKIKLMDFYKNKLLYIDFWASWCAPCKVEMPNSKMLKDKYSKKGIDFIYISTDKNPAAWERAMNQIGLQKDESYILPNSNESLLAKRFKIKAIPRYLIIGKDGKIINENAPSPSDPKLIKIFDELLMEQKH